MSLFVPFCAALAGAAMVMTVVQTWAAYPGLPSQVPLGLDWKGAARSLAPRPMIWFIVVIQIFIAAVILFAGYAIATHMPGTHGTLPGLSIFSVLLMAMMWRVQMLLISAAKSGGKPVPMNGFWKFLAAWVVLALLDVFLIG